MKENKEYYSSTKRVFSLLAPFYDLVSVLLSFGLISKLRDKVVDFTNARAGARILDVATGTGEQALAFAKRGYNVIGVDLSEAMLKVARRKNKYGNAKFELADAVNLPFNDNIFDVVAVSFALHDMPLTIREKALKEMVRVTKPAGKIVIIDYALPENKIGRFFIYNFIKLYEKSYYSEFIMSDLKDLLARSGIKIEAELPALFGAAKVLRGRKI